MIDSKKKKKKNNNPGIICGPIWGSSQVWGSFAVGDHLRRCTVLPITFLYYESVSALMHDINNNKAPVNKSNLFQKTSNIHSYNTRSSTSGKF